MSYLSDYMLFTSGTECPEKYRIWAGLSLLSHSLGMRFWYMHGRWAQYASHYTVLVGDAGSGKTTAKNFSSKIFKGEYPTQLVSSSFQSYQDILDQMANTPEILWEEALPDGTKKIHHYSPFYVISNELSSLLTTDKEGMVNFLVDIHDTGEVIDTGFKGQRKENPGRKQKVDFPFVSILACATPEWFVGNLKMELFKGGLGRRLILVYDEKTDEIPDPVNVTGGEAAKERVIAHLHSLDKLYGEIKRSPAAKEWWHDWYHKQKKKNEKEMDPILKQFGETAHIAVIKIAMTLVASEVPFTFTVEPAHFEFAAKLIEDLRPGIIRLTSGIGRNELAGVGAQLLDYLSRTGGAAPMQNARKIFRRYADRPEFKELLDSFIETEELFIYSATAHGVQQEILMLPDYFCNMMKDKPENHPVYPAYKAYLMRRNGDSKS